MRNLCKGWLLTLVFAWAPVPSTTAQAVVMQEVGRFTLPGWTTDIAVSGTLCYLKNQSTLYVIDVTDATAPVLLGSHMVQGSSLFVVEPYVYTAGDEFAPRGEAEHLSVVDVSDPGNMRTVGAVRIERASHVFVAGNYAYVTRYFYPPRLYVVDIADPTNPTVISFVETAATANNVFVSGPYAYVAEGEIRFGSVRIYDVSNPRSPRMAAVYRSGYVDRVFVVEPYVYLLDRVFGFQIIDFSDFTLPLEMSAMPREFLRQAIKIVGNRAYLGAYQMIYVVDISDPVGPRELGRYQPSAPVWGLDLDDNYIYVANSTIGLVVLSYQGFP